jgi:hypothetical protein
MNFREELIKIWKVLWLKGLVRRTSFAAKLLGF